MSARHRPAASRRAGCRAAGERGAVTAELAIALLGVTGVLAGLLSLGAVVQAQLRVHDAAAAAARLAARGEAPARVQQVAGRLGGDGARVGVSAGAGTTRVTVSRTVRLMLPGSPTVEVDSAAEAVTETPDGAP